MVYHAIWPFTREHVNRSYSLPFYSFFRLRRNKAEKSIKRRNKTIVNNKVRSRVGVYLLQDFWRQSLDFITWGD